jgi:hypothetical protein
MSVTRRTAWRVALGLSLLASGGAAVAATSMVNAQDPVTPTEVVTITPYRILDTRNGTGATGQVGAGQSIDVQMAGVGPVPANAVGVVLNLTGTQVSAPTFVTAWPTGTDRPTTSVLNLRPGVDSPNGVIAMLGTDGKISLYNESGSIDLIADVAGYLLPAGAGGQPGPAGPQGPAGAQGPAGPAAALGRVVIEDEGEFPAGAIGATTFGSATCPAGKVATGGGVQLSPDSGVVMASSFTDAIQTWVVGLRRITAGVATPYSVWVVCINAG